MKKVSLLFLFFISYTFLVAQPDTTNTFIWDFAIYDGTFSYRSPNTNGGVGTFFDKTNWDSSPYKQGHLKQLSTGNMRMNYRFLEPQGWDPNYKPGYPLIVMLHGAVERANCYDGSCYFGSTAYRPHTVPNNTITTSGRNNLLNNDHQLLNGGAAHLNARNRSQSKKPDDPTLNTRAWPGFVLFPQMLNGWNTPTASVTDIHDMIRVVRLFLKKYNIDPNRVYIHGLSNGGRGVMLSVVEADWLFAAAAPMSPIPSHSFYYSTGNVNDVSTVPIWLFQGGKDGNPTPAVTQETVRQLTNKGANVRYTLYPDLGHGVWNTAYAEPDFFTWFLNKNKSDIHVPYGLARVCATTGTGVKLTMPREMWAFQWEKDGVIIPGATSYQYTATEPGSYRGRFSRVANPTESQWNQWSKPVEVISSAPPVPTITHTRSVMLKDLNESDSTVLTGPSGYNSYKWYRTTPSSGTAYGQLSGLTSSSSGFLKRPCSDIPATATCRGTYNYYVQVGDIDGCYSNNRNTPKTVWFSDLAPATIPRPTGFTGQRSGNTDVLLRWNDDSGQERGYEIWRAKSTQANTNSWTLVTITAEDAVLYLDKNLEQGVTYYYKIRAVSDLARSPYAPSDVKNSNSTSDNVIVSTLSDTGTPSVPQDLAAEIIDTDITTQTCSIRVTWSPSTDDYGVKHYKLNYNNTSVFTTATADTISGIAINGNIAFTVQAEDFSNHVSSQSAQVNVDTRIIGLYWIHSTSFYTDLTQIPEPKWQDREFSGKTNNLDVNVASQDSYVLIKFYGYLYVSTEGQYKFRVRNNDGVNFFLDGNSIIYYNNYVQAGCVTTDLKPEYPSVYLSQGVHRIEMRYWQSEDDRCLEWDWQGFDAGPDPEGWYPIPDSRLQSFDSFTPPSPPSVPTDLAATGTAMDQITLTWDYSGDAAEFEIYRSSANNGPWTMVSRVESSPYVDGNLQPSTTYYYRIRSVNQYGTSAYTPVVSGATLDDVVVPTQPTNLTLFSNTLTSASIGWTPSSDNLGVVGYEIWVNGVVYTTTPFNYHVVTNLTPQTTVSIYVVAYDARNNKSTPSATLEVPLTGAETFYAKPSGNLNVTTTWGKNADGTGDQPANFNTNGYYFVVSRPTASVASWTVNGTVSKIIVPNGVQLTVTTGLQGNVELQGNATIILPNNTQPTFLSISPQSTVRYTSTTTQTVQAATYGNLELSGSGSKVFASGTTTIGGTLTVSPGVGISGTPGNLSTVVLHGDLLYSGSPQFTSSSNAVVLDLKKTGIQTLAFSGTLDLFELKCTPSTTINLNNLGSPSTLNLGSSNGGGLSLPTGSSLYLQGNTLKVIGAGTVNPNNEAGTIFASGATIDISSTSNSNSNLNFDAANKLLASLNVNLTGSGVVNVNNPINISDGIKIRAGDLVSNGNITLLSTPTKTANLQQIEANGRLVGNVNVQRYFSTKARMYRYISAAVTGVTIQTWQQFFGITGDFVGSTTGVGFGTGASLYIQSNTGTWVAYPDKDYASPYNTVLAPIEMGKGYSAYIRNTTPFTMTTTGTAHQGSVPYTLIPASGSFDGWNLVGNPYASTIQWSTDPSAWSNRSNISNIVAVRNNLTSTTGQFLYYDPTTGLGTKNGLGTGEGGTLIGGRIAPGQAFYVMATGPNPTLTINEAAKVAAQQDLYREGENEASHLYLALKQGDLVDEAIVTFTDFGTDAFDANYDAPKLKNEGMFNFSTLTNNEMSVAINNMSNSFCGKSIRLNLENVEPGDYVLQIPSAESLHGVGSLELVDHFLNKKFAIEQFTEIQFTVTSEPLSAGNNRFELVMNRPDLNMELVASNATQCTDPGRIALANTQKGASYTVISASGEEVTTSQRSMGGDLIFSVPNTSLKEGVNEFKVKAFFEGCITSALSETITINHITAPAIEVEDKSTCFGESASIRIDSENTSIAGYVWYNAENEKIKGFTSETFETEPITAETVYSVAALLKNGCEGPRYGFVVYPQVLDEPQLTLINDTLFVNVNVAEYKWRRNGEVISLTGDNFLTNLAGGEYEVTCSLGGCSKTSKVFLVTGAEEGPDAAFEYSIFPNPTASNNIRLKVVTRSREDVLVKVVDVLGKEHYINSFSPEALRESVTLAPRQDFRSGVYYVILKQSSTLRELKLIIKE
jgi:predicted esterase